MMDALLFYKLTYEPNDSGELKINHATLLRLNILEDTKH